MSQLWTQTSELLVNFGKGYEHEIRRTHFDKDSNVLDNVTAMDLNRGIPCQKILVLVNIYLKKSMKYNLKPCSHNYY